MRRLAFVGAATIAAAVGCSASDANESSAAEGATQDLSSPRPWCPKAEAIDVAQSPDDYLPPMTVKLGSVIDGDTAYFDDPSGMRQRVRFMHINAEEVHHDDASPAQNAKATPFGEMTKTHVTEILSRATTIQLSTHRDPVHPDQPESDVFSRWLSLVWVDGQLLQQQLIADGYSGYYTKYGCAQGQLHDALLFSEADANQHNRGVWDPQYKNEHLPVLTQWIGLDKCRPNPLQGDHYCPAFESGQTSTP